MEFIGKNGKAAPRLKDAGLTGDKICQASTGQTIRRLTVLEM